MSKTLSKKKTSVPCLIGQEFEVVLGLNPEACSLCTQVCKMVCLNVGRPNFDILDFDDPILMD